MQNVMQALYLTRNVRGLPASARRYNALAQNGRALRLEYYRLTQPDTHGPQYGAAIRCLSADGEDYAAVPAITVCPGRIERLLALLSEHTVTPVTLRDVITDLL